MSKKRTVGTNTFGYNQKRNFINLPFQRYTFKKAYDLYKIPNFLHYQLKKSTHPKYNFSFNDLNLNSCNILHFFNSISHGTTPWVVTVEERIPRWGKISKEQTQKALSLMAGAPCKRILPFSQHAYNVNLEQLDQFPSFRERIEAKMEVIYPSQEQLISSYQEKTLSKDHIICSIIGSDFFRKGGKEILLAFEQLLKENKPVKLNIVSSLQYGDYASRTTQADYQEALSIIEKYSKNISWYSYLENHKVLELLKQSHIGLLPTFDDTFGYSLLEAQAAGCPVISTDIRSLPEINNEKVGWLIKIPKNNLGKGYFADDNIRKQMSDKITKGMYVILNELLNSPEIIRQKGEKAMERIKLLHNPQITARAIESIYDNIK